MRECLECGSTENIDQHHTSYEPEETVMLCRSCHQSVHGDESHELHPSDERQKKTVQISHETKDLIDETVSGGSYAEKVQKLVDGYNQEGKSLDESDVRAIVEREIESLKREMR